MRRGKRLSIDPVSRVEGHLRVTIDAEATSRGSHRIVAAYNSATMFRGIESVLEGRDPGEVQHLAARVCGMCSAAHSIASVRAVEQAIGLPAVPDNARLVRNMLQAAETAFAHIVWFYQLNLLDYVDVAAAARESRPTLPALVRLKETLAHAVSGGPDVASGPFASGWWGHPAYLLPPDSGLELMHHYVEALTAQSQAASAAAVLGGKHPMVMNLSPGGLSHLPDISRVLAYQARMRDVRRFVEGTLASDLSILISHYGAALASGGRGHGHYLTWGAFDDLGQDPHDRVFPRGLVRADEPRHAAVDPEQVRVYTGRSFYPDDSGEGRHPLSSPQEPTRFRGFDDPSDKYDWTRAPRLGLESLSPETGPVAQIAVAYSRERPEVVGLTDNAVDSLEKAIGLGSGPEERGAAPGGLPRLSVLGSTLGRMVARVTHLRIVADLAVRWADELLDNVGRRDRQFFSPRLVPDRTEGVGACDAPRGALAHWVRIRRGRVIRYAIVAPSAWNLSPRDDRGVPGPLEKSLEGIELLDRDRPLEALRVIHSFDPCMGCAVHILDADKSAERPS